MKNSTFYVKDFCIITNPDEINLSNFGAIKRRLAMVDKAAISVIDKVFTPDVKEIIYTSRFGEFERLDKIIEEYTEMNEVSPMKFSGSVHNYPIGCFNLVKQLNIPYSCISSGKNSISTGLVQCAASFKEVLFCYSDFWEGEIKAFSCLISKEVGRLKFEIQRGGIESADEFKGFCDLILGKNEEFSSDFIKVRKV